jgi:hypothetical protein
MSALTLAEVVARYGRDAYLLTIASDGPHTSFVSVDLKGNVIACSIGKSAAKNIASKPNVSLFWPPRDPGGYALVLNGTATGGREPSGVTRAEITLTKISPSSPRTEASRQRWAVCVRLSARDKAYITRRVTPKVFRSELGHPRPMQPVLLAGSCPLRSRKRPTSGLPRNDAMRQH